MFWCYVWRGEADNRLIRPIKIRLTPLLSYRVQVVRAYSIGHTSIFRSAFISILCLFVCLVFGYFFCLHMNKTGIFLSIFLCLFISLLTRPLWIHRFRDNHDDFNWHQNCIFIIFSLSTAKVSSVDPFSQNNTHCS